MSFAVSCGSDCTFAAYVKSISSFPILNPHEENELAKKWTNEGDVKSAQKIVTSHLRMVVKIALRFVNYGLPVMDMVSEGNIGLMKAVKNFNYRLGYRVSTYASWWVKASIQEYILKSWSIVKIGTSSVQKKLFFGLNRIKRRLLKYGSDNLNSSDIKKISSELCVPADDVKRMDSLLSNPTYSLDISNDYENGTLSDRIPSNDPCHGLSYIQEKDSKLKKEVMRWAIDQLNPRYRDIIIKRRLLEKPITLEKVGLEHKGISKERVRQIEQQAMKKLKQLCDQKMSIYISQNSIPA